MKYTRDVYKRQVMIMPKILIVATGIGAYANAILPTGLWLSELTHIYLCRHPSAPSPLFPEKRKPASRPEVLRFADPILKSEERSICLASAMTMRMIHCLSLIHIYVLGRLGKIILSKSVLLYYLHIS